MLHRSLLLALSTVALLFMSCSDEKVTRVIPPPTNLGEVIGRIDSNEPGVDVALWQASVVAHVAPDSAGYFALTQVPSGIYDLHATTPSGAHHFIANLTVTQGQTLSLGTIALSNLPAPLLDIRPTGDHVDLPAGYTTILVKSERPLDVASLASAVTFDPALAGTWQEREFLDWTYTYGFTPEEDVRTNAAYTMTVGSDLRLLNGGAWGRSYVNHFTTEGFGIESMRFPWGESSSPSLPVSFDLSYLGTFDFNCAVDEHSFADGITLTPNNRFSAIIGQGQRSASILLDEALTPATDYVLEVKPPLADVYGSLIDTPLVVRFRTRGLALISRTLSASQNAMPLIGRRELFSDEYNLDLDPATIAPAIHIDPECAHLIESTSSNAFRVVLTGDSHPATNYTVTIDRSLSTNEGVSLDDEQSIVFHSDTFRLDRVEISNQPFGDFPDSLEPGRLFLRAAFNAKVEPSALAAALSITPPIPGVWAPPDGDQEALLRYSTDEPYPLVPEQSYELRIDGAAPLVDGAGIGDDFLRAIRVNPVKVLTQAPAAGDTSVYRATAIDFRFNARMDVVATEGAFSFSVAGGDAIHGAFTWSDENTRLTFHAGEVLAPKQYYDVAVTDAARDVTGHPLRRGVAFRFRTRS